MLIRGTVRGTRQGFAFLVPENGGEDIFIPEVNLSGAIDGDRVEVRLERSSPRDFRAEGFVDQILERRNPAHTGDVVRSGRTLFVHPDTPILPPRLRLRTGGQAVPAGSKILFDVDNVGRENKRVATFVRLLGDADDPHLDGVVIATAFHLPVRFPDSVLDEALEVASREDPVDRARRHDYTGELVLTIDPRTAKDFDDAVSIRKSRKGYRLTVHIADASYYVPEGGAIDAEAARRGTSVYFPGGVVPMLPEALSARAASLVPDEDRRVLSVEIDLDRDGGIKNFRCREGVIRSAARLHYQQAQRMLNGNEGEPPVRNAVREMGELARLLRARRYRAGGFDLDLPETEVELDARGLPRRLMRRRTLESHRIIEEFMILANRAVGRFLAEKGAPHLFRVHGEPDPASLARFAEIALTLVPGARTRDLETIPALRRFLGQLSGDPIGRIVQFFFLRTLKKAVYSPVDIGHFGLGIDRYCHFTSPIRRYPDLFNHRIVRAVLREDRAGGPVDADRRRWHGQASAHAISSSRSEQNAEKAEREMVRLKALRWAESRLGELFAGRVVGMVPAGLFVELDKHPVEGFVPRESLGSGARYMEERLAFVDRRGRDEVRLGDPVDVQIVRVDLQQRDLELRRLRDNSGHRRTLKRGIGRQGTSDRRRGISPRKQRSSRVKPQTARADRGKRVKQPGEAGRHHSRKRGRG